MFVPSTSVAEIGWPAIPGGGAAAVLSVLFQLEQSQWLSADELQARQREQLARVIRHAYRTVPFYQTRFDQTGLDPEGVGTPERFCQFPPLTRRDVQLTQQLLHSTEVPKAHGRVTSTVTSGSTGAPVAVLGTDVTQFFWRALTLRDHLWHHRDFSQTFASIRYNKTGGKYPTGDRATNWGVATDGVFATGPAYMLSIRSSLEEQAEWLERINPRYLLSYPSVFKALAHHFQIHGRTVPNLRELRSFGEILEPDCRAACQAAWRVPVVDMYSSQEVGYVTLQCPETENHHVQSESVLVEVLDDAGDACAPGEIGRVVVSTLHNFAMPLLRYEIGDFAEVGESCPCGRGLPVLKRILGRQRNLLTFPTGERRWPLFAEAGRPEDLPPFFQFQIIQRSLDEVDVFVVRHAPFTAPEETIVKRYIQQTLGHPFIITLRVVAEIPRSVTGKFEDFISHVNPAHSP